MATVTYHAHLEGRTAAISFDGQILNPGPNDLEPEAAERLRRHPDLGGYVARGVIEFGALPTFPTVRFYRVVRAVTHNHQAHQPGTTLALTEPEAALLLTAGFVEHAQQPLAPPSPLSTLGEGEPEPEEAPAKNDTVSFLDLNQATLAELVALPRIGEATARKLIAARPLANLRDAQFVAGMSDVRWAEVAPLVTV